MPGSRCLLVLGFVLVEVEDTVATVPTVYQLVDHHATAGWMPTCVHNKFSEMKMALLHTSHYTAASNLVPNCKYFSSYCSCIFKVLLLELSLRTACQVAERRLLQQHPPTPRGFQHKQVGFGNISCHIFLSIIFLKTMMSIAVLAAIWIMVGFVLRWKGILMKNVCVFSFYLMVIKPSKKTETSHLWKSGSLIDVKVEWKESSAFKISCCNTSGCWCAGVKR